MHVHNSPEVPRLEQSQGANRNMRLNRRAVVVVTRDIANVPVSAGQEEFPLVLANNPRGMRVLQSHRPERLCPNLVQPVRVAALVGAKVNMEGLPMNVISQGDVGCIQVNVTQLRRNHVRRERSQARTVSLHLIQTFLAQEHDPRVHLNPALRADDPYGFRDSLERPASRRVALNYPQAAPCSADHVGVQTGNHRLRLRSNVSRQR